MMKMMMIMNMMMLMMDDYDDEPDENYNHKREYINGKKKEFSYYKQKS